MRSTLLLLLAGLLLSCSSGGPETVDPGGSSAGAGGSQPAVSLRAFPGAGGGRCTLYGRFLAPPLPQQSDRARVEELGRWRLLAGGHPLALDPSSAVGWLMEPDGVTRSVALWLQVAACPEVPASATLEFEGQQTWSAALSAGGDAIWSAEVQPVIVDGAGLSPPWLDPDAIEASVACLLPFYEQRCHVRLTTRKAVQVPFPAGKDDYRFGAVSSVPTDPWVVSQSAQALRAAVPGKVIPLFLVDDGSPVGANFNNEATGYTLYEIHADLGGGNLLQTYWARPEIRIRTDADWSLTDPLTWTTAPAPDPSALSLVSLVSRRFPVSLLHELGHVLGLPHPTESGEIPDDAGLNVMNRSGFFSGTTLAPLYKDATSPADFGPTQCAQLLAGLDLSSYQCLVAARNIPGLSAP